MSPEPYKYKDILLTPTVFKDLLIKLFTGKQFTRQQAIQVIAEYHTENGGIVDSKTNLVDCFKYASRKAKDVGLKNVGYGTWRLCEIDKEYEIVKTNGQPSAKLKAEIFYKSDVEIGNGKQSVYIYYYDTYKKLAVAQNSQHWLCKIGRSEVDTIQRIVGQASTCVPEVPHIAIIIHCNDSFLLEKAFHDILKIKKRWEKNSPGKEWFYTNPEEILEIYNYIVA